MPVAMFEFTIVNNSSDALTYTLAGTLGNYGSNSGTHTFSQINGQALAAAPHHHWHRRLHAMLDCWHFSLYFDFSNRACSKASYVVAGVG